MTKAERIRLIRTSFEEIERIEGEIPCILWRHTKHRDVYLYSREDESLANHEIFLVKSSTPKIDKALKYAVKHYFQTAEELAIIVNSLVVSYTKPEQRTQHVSDISLPEKNHQLKSSWREASIQPLNSSLGTAKTQRFNANFIDSAFPERPTQQSPATVSFSQQYQSTPKKKRFKSIIGAIAVLILLLIAYLTNPDVEKHQLVVQDHVQTLRAQSSGDNSIQKASVVSENESKSTVTSVVDRTDFFLFSLTKLRLPTNSKTIGLGMFGNVFLSDEKINSVAYQLADNPLTTLSNHRNTSVSNDELNNMKSTVIVAVMEKFFTDPNKKNELTYKFVFHNRSDRDLKLLRGEVVFSNNNGEVLEVLPLIYDRELGTNEKAIYHVTQQVIPTNSRTKKLVETKLSDLVIDWEPAKIQYSDGTSLSM